MKKLVLAIVAAAALAFAATTIGISIGSPTPAHADPCSSPSCDEINIGVAQFGEHSTAMTKAVRRAKSLRQKTAAMGPLRTACREGQQAVKVGDKILTLAKRPSCGRKADQVAAFDKSLAEVRKSVGDLCAEVSKLGRP